jgi:site-specific DNA-methyltransferase (adenine-specific)
MTQTPNDKDIKLENAFVMYGDSIKRLKELPDNSVDSIVTDPPYGLSDNKFVADTIAKWINGERDFIPDGKGFMGKAWDSFVPPPAIWDECLRVLKPGGHLLAFFGSRTQDVGALSIRLAGFEIRDSISWVYGSGFPKSLDISKAIDKSAGAEREVIGKKNGANLLKSKGFADKAINGHNPNVLVTAPSTDAAKKYEGWGTALKPAHEPIVVARKPLSESTVANNVLQWGTGGLNIDASRIGTTDRFGGGAKGSSGFAANYNAEGWTEGSSLGRFPANFILSHTEDCEDTGETTMIKSNGHWAKTKVTGFGDFGNGSSEYQGVGHKPGEESTPVFRCAEGCPVAELDKQSGVSKSVSANMGAGLIEGIGAKGLSKNAETFESVRGHNDSGGASRFFYVAKASKKDRNEGLAELEATVLTGRDEGQDGRQVPYKTRTKVTQNIHPTVKPTQLMEYLVKLVTPEGGTVLDPFTGSGSTGKAALLNGFKFIGCELTEEYLPIIEGRLSWASANKDKYQADKVAAVTKANKVAQNTRSKATGGSMTALDAAQVALEQIAAKKANKADNQLPLFDEVEE